MDSHLDLPVVDASMELLWRRELPPFQAAIAAGVRSIMTAHIRVPVLTGDLPATFSPEALIRLLRKELGFGGAIVSDALEMQGASGAIGVPEAAVRALVAGNDLLCFGGELVKEPDTVARGARRGDRVRDRRGGTRGSAHRGAAGRGRRPQRVSRHDPVYERRRTARTPTWASPPRDGRCGSRARCQRAADRRGPARTAGHHRRRRGAVGPGPPCVRGG